MRQPTILLALLFSFLLGCNIQSVKKELVVPSKMETLDKQSPFLKVHMLKGNLYILHDWTTSEDSGVVSGVGEMLDVARARLDSGSFVIGIDSVVIFETNVLETSGSVTALTVFTGITLAVTMYCIISPKTCFGSCPTFYVEVNDNSFLEAEGFSSSVLPHLEASDVDALYRVHPVSRNLRITMKNEALETHIVRSVNLLAVPHRPGNRVARTRENRYFEISEFIEPVSAVTEEGSVLESVRQYDRNELVSKTDSVDLTKQERIRMTFSPPSKGRFGVVIAARQSLLSTYLFYQTLAYLGTSASSWFAEAERESRNGESILPPWEKVLGRIQVEVKGQAEPWVAVGQAGETGPLATDIFLVPLPHSASPFEICLEMTRGMWRVDYIALVKLEEEVFPTVLAPVRVFHRQEEDSRALKKLLDSTQTLVTLPGDTYDIDYLLPEHFSEHEFFLQSRGYYLEWIRQEWLAEENPAKAMQFFLDPQLALRSIAPEFKRQEAQMDSIFWNSRYAK